MRGRLRAASITNLIALWRIVRRGNAGKNSQINALMIVLLSKAWHSRRIRIENTHFNILLNFIYDLANDAIQHTIYTIHIITIHTCVSQYHNQ